MKTGSSAAGLAVMLALLSPLLWAEEEALTLELTPVANDPAYASDMARLLQLDNGVVVQGADLTTPEGYTSGFRLSTAYSPYNLPQLDLGAEITYHDSDEVPLSHSAGDALLMNLTSVGGSLVAGLRLGRLGLYAKTGFAEWTGEPLESPEQSPFATAGTSRIQGFGARLDFPHASGRLEFEEIDAPSMKHLNLLTASLHIPF